MWFSTLSWGRGKLGNRRCVGPRRLRFCGVTPQAPASVEMGARARFPCGRLACLRQIPQRRPVDHPWAGGRSLPGCDAVASGSGQRALAERLLRRDRHRLGPRVATEQAMARLPRPRGAREPSKHRSSGGRPDRCLGDRHQIHQGSGAHPARVGAPREPSSVDRVGPLAGRGGIGASGRQGSAADRLVLRWISRPIADSSTGGQAGWGARRPRRRRFEATQAWSEEAGARRCRVGRRRGAVRFRARRRSRPAE